MGTAPTAAERQASTLVPKTHLGSPLWLFAKTNSCSIRDALRPCPLIHETLEPRLAQNAGVTSCLKAGLVGPDGAWRAQVTLVGSNLIVFHRLHPPLSCPQEGRAGFVHTGFPSSSVRVPCPPLKRA